jgi:hypothetical protein
MIHKPNPTLAQTVERAYQLFATYPITKPLDVCTDCCITEEEEKELLKRPVRDISKETLSHYTTGASSGNTPIHEIKHFLPRYLHLISQFDFPSHSVEISLRRLASISSADWAGEEGQLMSDFSVQFFLYCLAHYPLPEQDTIEVILIMFWNGGRDIKPLLAAWADEIHANSVLHYRDLLFRTFKGNGKLSNGFGDDPRLAELLFNWAHAPGTQCVFANAIETLVLANEPMEPEDWDDLNLLYDRLG